MNKLLYKIAPVFISTFIVMGGGMFYVVSNNYNLGFVFKIYKNFNYYNFLCPLSIIFISFCFRSLRMKILLGNCKIKFSSIMQCIGLGCFFNIILPLRLGDVLQANAIKLRSNLDASKALGIILFEKISDLLLLMLMSIILVYFLFDFKLKLGVSKELLTILAFGGLMFFLLAIIFNTKIKDLVSKKKYKLKMVIFFQKIISNVIIGFGTLKSKTRISLYIMLTFLVWITETLIIYHVARIFGIELSFLQSFFVEVCLVLTFVCVISPAQIGIYELAIMFALSVLGCNSENALAFAVFSHLIIILFYGVLGTMSCFIFGNNVLKWISLKYSKV